MIDGFVILTPILVLCIVALLGFAGCDWVFGLTDVPPHSDPPSNLAAIPGDKTVQLTWEAPPNDVAAYNIKRGLIPLDPNPTIAHIPAPATAFTDGAPPTLPLLNGTAYYYRVSAVGSDQTESLDSNESVAVPAIPNNTLFVLSPSLGTLRNNFTGWVGMAIQVGPASLAIYGLGRMFAPGNSSVHTIKIVDAATAVDLPGGFVSVNMATGTLNNFVYGTLAAPVTLNANTLYYVVSQETLGGEQWYDDDTTIQTTGVASVTGSIFGDGSGPFSVHGMANHTYGPLDFRY